MTRQSTQQERTVRASDGKTEAATESTSKTSRKPKNRKNREFAVITYLFLAMFVCLMGYFTWFQFTESEKFINSPYNKRQDLFARRIVRGEIRAADGTVLADTVADSEGNETRRYPYGRIFSHVVGYSENGRSGIESQANFSLLRSNIFYGEKALSEIQGEKSPGDNVTTTLNFDLQLTAFDALSHYRGAVVVLEPATGKILAMVSKPDFDPNTIGADWEMLVSDDNSDAALLNRATQGLYPPGSTFKIFTTLAYIHEHPDYESYRYQCTGEHTVGNQTIHCYNNRSHGTQDLKASFSNSCNSSYAALGLDLDLNRFSKLCDNLLFNTALPTTFESSKSSFVLSEGAGAGMIMGTAIGQGKTLVTPFHMALVTGAIANNGILMRPYVIDRITDADDGLVEQKKPEEYQRLLTPEDAAILQEYLRAVVENGTGEKLKSDIYTAYGKTGSAEFSSTSKASHSWFVGYAHKDGTNDIAVSVIVEDSGVGSEYAVPIAREIFDAYYRE